MEKKQISGKEFQQHVWNSRIESELQRLLEIAIAEDVETTGDLTSKALIPEKLVGSATIRTRQYGVAAGIPAVPTVLASVDNTLVWKPALEDGTVMEPGTSLGIIEGPTRSLLTAERPVLNLLGRLCGIATLTRQYVQAISETSATIYDTRKTTLGWRRLEKYAVRCGGGRNHRTGLFDAILIKDNHLAFGAEGDGCFTPFEAVVRARQYLDQLAFFANDSAVLGAGDIAKDDMSDHPLPIIEIEVDTLDQLREVLAAGPDIVLLDNMKPKQLREAIEIRNALGIKTELEASGGISLDTVRAVAETGVERISVGALTHSAIALDLGLDWGKKK